MEVSILEMYRCYSFACLQGSPCAFRCLHFELFNFRYLLSELRLRIGLHLLLGFGTKKILLKKPKDDCFFIFSIASFCIKACNASIRGCT